MGVIDLLYPLYTYSNILIQEYQNKQTIKANINKQRIMVNRLLFGVNHRNNMIG